MNETEAQLLNLLYNIVDRMYIGRIPKVGSLALIGVGLCFPIIMLVTAFTYLFGNGGGPLCAMERVRGNEDEAENLMGNTFSMLVLTGAVLMVLGLLFYKPVLLWHLPTVWYRWSAMQLCRRMAAICMWV